MCFCEFFDLLGYGVKVKVGEFFCLHRFFRLESIGISLIISGLISCSLGFLRVRLSIIAHFLKNSWLNVIFVIWYTSNRSLGVFR